MIFQKKYRLRRIYARTPGFTLLALLTPPTLREVQSCVPMNDRLYIYQVLCLEVTMQQNMFPHSTEHGPCESEVKGVEYDIVVCLACDFWPSSAYSWIDRYHSWPDKDIVNAIVRSGCHCVPIGNPLGLHTQEDWRISFSQAEHQLVQTRTHCHFLVYGLLKIFLKEVIDNLSVETKNLLCFYHIKTVVF